MKRDLLVFGLVTTAAGIIWLVLLGMSYVNGVVTYNSICSGAGYSAVACQTAIAQQSLLSYWMLTGLAVFIVGLWATARSFMTGADLLESGKARYPAFEPQPAAPPGRICPACKTWQTAPFCPNDGTRLS